MHDEKIPGRQLSAWLFAAIVPVALQMMHGGWLWALCFGGFSMVLAVVLWRRPRKPAKLESAILILYVTILLGQLLHNAAKCWPVGNSDPAVPLILLVLAALSTRKGLSAAARVGAVLFWIVLGLYLAVFVAGMKDVKLEWLQPRTDNPSPLAFTIFLMPCAVMILLGKSDTPGGKGILTVLFVVLGMLMTAGVLSPEMVLQLPNAFYEMSRSLELAGVARRFEALICAGATVGWFATMSLLLTLCGEYFQNFQSGKQSQGVWLAAVGATVWKLCGLHIRPGILLGVGTVFWVVIPLLTQGLGREKKS